jgi:hypothetical protein
MKCFLLDDHRGKACRPAQFDKQFGKFTVLSIVEGLTTGVIEGIVFS